MAWRIGVDIGGTFTDVALVDDATGAIGIAKTPTTPRDFGRGVIRALEHAIESHGVPPGDVTLLSHATTVVTNAVLEETGARTALISTRGFRDILELRRSSRGDLYDLFQDPPQVLVPRHRRLEITERIDAQGEVVIPLAEDEIEPLIAEIERLEVEAVAVSLLFSFLNHAHERVLGERLRAALPDIPVFLSSEVLPEVREFERTSTVAVCAYVGPILASYLRSLEEATGGLGLPQLHVMGSAGGVFDVEEALEMPAAVVESGPAAGVIAAALIGEQTGQPNLLSFDMGGTTAKASLIKDGEIETTSEYEVGGGGSQNRWLHGTGHPVRVPVIDLAEVSAGGGSIAWLDPAGSLRVGPRSAGAEPGPVCYGQGGEEPTLTDVMILVGYMDPENFLGGSMRLDLERTRAIFKQKIADPLGLGVEEAAIGIFRIAAAQITDLIHEITVERGLDPRDFVLHAFGGSCPTVCGIFAAELSVKRVVIPYTAAVNCAFGLVSADIVHEYSITKTLPVPATAEEVNAIYAPMLAAATARLREEGFAESGTAFEWSIDLRYGRQVHEVTTPVRGATPVDEASLAALVDDFEALYERKYGKGSAYRAAGMEMTMFRLTARGLMKRPEIEKLALGGKDAGAAKTGRRPIFVDAAGALVESDIYDFELLAPGNEITGPAVIHTPITTIVLQDEQTGLLDEYRNMVIQFN